MDSRINRRNFILSATALGGAAAIGGVLPRSARAQSGKLKVGLMLPYSGTYAQLGNAIENGFRLFLLERGGRLAGREVEIVKVDDESDPAKAPENTSRLIKRDKVDLLVGTVHTGVAMAMLKQSRETGTLHIIPNAGAGAATGALCAPNVFRTSFTNWQAIYPLGKHVYGKGQKTAVWITWKYGAGEEAGEGFKEGFVKAGGRILRELHLPFPQVEFQPLLTEIASIRPDAVVCFFAGAAGAKFIKDYAAAGLKNKIPLYSSFLTEGILDAVGNAAEGIETTAHYGDSLDMKKNDEFRLAYAKAFGSNADVFAVQGYDTAQLFAAGIEAVKGDVDDRKGIIAAMESAVIDSPRGVWTMSKAHNPIQDIYLRRVVGNENKVVGIAHKALADPALGCRMV
ncbi:ABC transporter substrate-binding protein [Thauera sinica]|uniref:ABC transporter substrate-binding protein n=1 Tax=Thauera sinica TaxID=2665146 RepID=A0ABW1ALE9_9RHOO|nr:ABC transporter substrate-binding protein [Thauera sp. K11]ATE59095.1 ABC transporter permease [Thauera sp. K11]